MAFGIVAGQSVDLSPVEKKIDDHIADKNNPHGVTAEQLGIDAGWELIGNSTAINVGNEQIYHIGISIISKNFENYSSLKLEFNFLGQTITIGSGSSHVYFYRYDGDSSFSYSIGVYVFDKSYETINVSEIPVATLYSFGRSYGRKDEGSLNTPTNKLYYWFGGLGDLNPKKPCGGINAVSTNPAICCGCWNSKTNTFYIPMYIDGLKTAQFRVTAYGKK